MVHERRACLQGRGSLGLPLPPVGNAARPRRPRQPLPPPPALNRRLDGTGLDVLEMCRWVCVHACVWGVRMCVRARGNACTCHMCQGGRLQPPVQPRCLPLKCGPCAPGTGPHHAEPIARPSHVAAATPLSAWLLHAQGHARSRCLGNGLRAAHTWLHCSLAKSIVYQSPCNMGVRARPLGQAIVSRPDMPVNWDHCFRPFCRHLR